MVSAANPKKPNDLLVDRSLLYFSMTIPQWNE